MFKDARRTYLTFLGLSTGIILFGALMVISASQVTGLTSNGGSFSISWKQLVSILIATPIAWFAAQLPLKRWQSLGPIFLPIAIFAMLLLIPFGRTINGNRNWISFGPIDAQPSEFAKVALIIWSAYLISMRKGQRELFFNLIFGYAVILGIVLGGGDLGSGIVIGLILGSLLFLAGINLRAISILGGAGLLGISYLVLSQSYRRERFTAFLHPFAEGIYKNAGWQPAHSLMALASGGFFGAGLGASKQKWGNLAEAHTDFIFSVIGEELGLFGTLLVITVLALLVFAIFKISLRAKDEFSKFAGIGIGCWIGFQSIINLASATSLIPVVGVTLPFVSYGGSSLVALEVALGFIAGIALRDPELRSINRRWPLRTRRAVR